MDRSKLLQLNIHQHNYFLIKFSLLQGLGIEVIDVKDIANDIPYPFCYKN